MIDRACGRHGYRDPQCAVSGVIAQSQPFYYILLILLDIFVHIDFCYKGIVFAMRKQDGNEGVLFVYTVYIHYVYM